MCISIKKKEQKYRPIVDRPILEKSMCTILRASNIEDIEKPKILCAKNWSATAFLTTTFINVGI